MARSVSKITGISVAGVGDPVTGLPLRFSTIATTISGTAIYVRVLTRFPSEVSEEVKPFTGKTRQSVLSWSLANLDNASEYGDEIRERMTSVSRPDACGFLVTAVTAAATSWVVQRLTGNTQPVNNSVIYLEREAVKITAITADTPTAGQDTFTVTRGIFGTAAAPHDVRADSDKLVYIQNPIIYGREVTRYDYDPVADTEVASFRGLLERPDAESSLAEWSYRARSSLAYFGVDYFGRGRVVVQGGFQHTGSESRTLYASEFQDLIVLPRGYGPLIDGEKIPLSDGKAILLVELDQHISAGPRRRPSYRIRSRPTGSTQAYPLIAGTDVNFDEYVDAPPKLAELREVLTSVDGAYHFGKDISAVVTPGRSPFTMIRNLLVSTGTATWTTGGARTVGTNGDYDLLPSPYGLAVPDALIDHTQIDDFEARTYPDLELRNLVIGETEKLPRARDVITWLCEGLFAFPITTETGKIGFGSVVDPGPNNVTASWGLSEIIPRSVTQTQSDTEPLREIVIRAGRVWHTDKTRARFTEFDLTGKVSKRYPHNAIDETVDAGFIGDADTGLNDIEFEAITDLFARRFRISNEPLPSYTVETAPHVAAVSAGRIVAITHPALLDNDAIRGVTAHRCLVLERKGNPGRGTNRYKVLDLYPLSKSDRVVSPCWEVEAITDATHFRVAAGSFTPDSTDRALWVDTYRYVLWSSQWTQRSATYTTGSINPATGDVTLAGAWSVSPAVGDIVRLPPWDDRDNWETLLYAWIAGSDAKLGAGSDTGHRWAI